MKELTLRLSKKGLSVRNLLILGGIVISLSACATTNLDAPPSAGSIREMMVEWDHIEKDIGRPNEQYRKQYAKSLRLLNDALAESKRYKMRVER
jgi:hypothetical protein